MFYFTIKSPSKFVDSSAVKEISPTRRNEIFRTEHLVENVPTKPNEDFFATTTFKKGEETLDFSTKPTATISKQNNGNSDDNTQISPEQILAKMQEGVTKECNYFKDNSETKTPYKIFIYDLPAYYNQEVVAFLDGKQRQCFDLNYCGTGKELMKVGTQNLNKYPDYIQEIRNTEQFALEVIFHVKLKHSLFRTLNPEEADIFYIPAYTGLNCLTFRENGDHFVNSLFDYLNQNSSKYYSSGKPHFMALSKIEREQASDMCTTLRHQDSGKITFIGIEREISPFIQHHAKGRVKIVAPYPSYMHFIPNPASKGMYEFQNGLRNLSMTQFRLNAPNLEEREVLLFLAASTRRSNSFRAELLDEFQFKTSKGFEETIEKLRTKSQKMPSQIMLITHECMSGHQKETIPWMRHSKYCLQPPGDSPTRKSIYDSILSGCIPILFRLKQGKTILPFEKYLDYTTFSYFLEESVISRHNKTVIEIVKEIPDSKTQYLHNNLIRIAKWFQYSLPNSFSNNNDDNAMSLILDELGSIHNLLN